MREYPTWEVGARVEADGSWPSYGVSRGDKGTVTDVRRGGAVRVFLDRLDAGRWFGSDQLRRAS